MTGATDTMVSEPLKAAAMTWLLRRDASEPSAAEDEAFAAWLAQSPDHREMYAAVEEFWSATAQLERHPGFETTRRWAIASVDRTRMTRRALAAGLAAVVIGLGGVSLYLGAGPRPLATQAFRTAVGQQATVTLPDGSVLTLNTDTVVRTQTDRERRLVYLDKGQAFFKVAKDPRHPFVVTAAIV